MIDYICNQIYLAYLKVKLGRLIRKTGYRIRSIETIPGPWDGNCRIRPLDDGFDHENDDCMCKPKVIKSISSDGTPYLTITHNRMGENI